MDKTIQELEAKLNGLTDEVGVINDKLKTKQEDLAAAYLNGRDNIPRLLSDITKLQNECDGILTAMSIGRAELEAKRVEWLELQRREALVTIGDIAAEVKREVPGMLRECEALYKRADDLINKNSELVSLRNRYQLGTVNTYITSDVAFVIQLRDKISQLMKLYEFSQNMKTHRGN